MSFGFSVGDCVLLLQIARTQYKNCVAAGTEYNEIAREVKSLYSILKILKDEASKTDSPLQRNEPKSHEELVGATEGCRQILEDLQTLLAKYEGLSGDGEAVSGTRKLWHKIRFGTKVQQLGEVRGKIITYTTTISVLLDAMHLKASGRLEDKVDAGFSNMMDSFLTMKNAIVEEVLKARSQPKGRSTVSLLSLSTYNEDDKEVWQEFRRELIVKGFNSKKLDRHKDILKSYMLRLEQCGILDQLKLPANELTPWWTKHDFLQTTETLIGPDLQPITEETSQSLGEQISKKTGWLKGPANIEVFGQRANVEGIVEEAVPRARNEPRLSKQPGRPGGLAAVGLVEAAVAGLYEVRRNQTSTDAQRDPLRTAVEGRYEMQRTDRERLAETNFRRFPATGLIPQDISSLTPPPPYESVNSDDSQRYTSSRPRTPLPALPSQWHEDEDLRGIKLLDETEADNAKQEERNTKQEAQRLQNVVKEEHRQRQLLKPSTSEIVGRSLREKRVRDQVSLHKKNPLKEQVLSDPSTLDLIRPALYQTTSDPGPALVLAQQRPTILQGRSKTSTSAMQQGLDPFSQRFDELSEKDEPKTVRQPEQQNPQLLEPRDIESYNSSLGLLENDKPAAISVQELQNDTVSNLSPTSIAVTLVDCGAIITKSQPARFAYAESVAESEPETQETETNINQPTLELLDLSGGGERIVPKKTNNNVANVKVAQSAKTKRRAPSPQIEGHLTGDFSRARPDSSTQTSRNRGSFTSPSGRSGSVLGLNAAPDRDNERRFVLMSRPEPSSNRRVKVVSTEPQTGDSKIEFVPAANLYDTSQLAEESERRRMKGRRDSPPPYRATRYYAESDDSSRSPVDTERSSQTQQAAKAALLAGATEAFRVRNEPGSWTGEKGKRILTAAIGAAGISHFTKDKNTDGKASKSKRHMLEAVIGGLAGNRIINGPVGDRGRSRTPRPRYESSSYTSGYTNNESRMPDISGDGRRRPQHTDQTRPPNLSNGARFMDGGGELPATRISTPYSRQGGEKLDPFEGRDGPGLKKTGRTKEPADLSNVDLNYTTRQVAEKDSPPSENKRFKESGNRVVNSMAQTIGPSSREPELTGETIKIIITNDQGRLSDEDIDRQLSETKNEDEAVRRSSETSKTNEIATIYKKDHQLKDKIDNVVSEASDFKAEKEEKAGYKVVKIEDDKAVIIEKDS